MTPTQLLAYHTARLLAALELAQGTVAPDFAATLAVYHATQAAHAAARK